MKLLLLASSMLCGTAYAASDKLAFAPAPDWVKPVAMPSAQTLKPDEAPIRILLSDQQTRLEKGRVTSYVNLALHIQTPQGLAAGNLSLPWNPETAEMTVHKLHIIREGKVIDVLEGGQTFTVVRREPNLENAMLDGVLTANIQPEGLQVGDTLEYALTISSSDPVLQGHVEEAGGSWNGLPFVRANFSAQWPSDMQIAVRQSGDLPVLKPVKSGNMTSVTFSRDNLEPVIPPRLAPVRYSIGRGIMLSNFRSWAEAGALLAPLYAEASRIPEAGPLRNELEKIKAASTDPIKRAEAALVLVQDRVRYVALLMGVGGLTPAKAEETWARRFGDCKAKTALLLALLHELGITADAVAVNVAIGDGMDERLPMIGLFNHVLVRATIGGKTYWMDGTRTGDTSLARLATPDFGWGLPLVAKDAALVRMLPAPLDAPSYDLSIDIDARSGLSLPAPVKAQVVLRGDEAIGTRLGLAGMAADARDNALRQYWKQRLDDVEITAVTARFDPATGDQHLAMEGTMEMDWSDSQYWTDSTRVGFDADFSRTQSSNNDAPFAVAYPSYDRTVETIRLPPGFTQSNIFRSEPIDETVAGTAYRRQSSLQNDVFVIERTRRAVMPEFAAKDAPAAQKRLRELHALPVSVRRPANYRITSAELDNELKETPKDAGGYFQRGVYLGTHNRIDEALAAWTKALELDSSHEPARAGLITNALRTRDIIGARKLAATQLADVKTSGLAAALGLLERQEDQTAAALAAFSRALELSPANNVARMQRAEIYHRQAKYDAALADVDAALLLPNASVDMSLLRANILRAQGKSDAAIAEATSLVTRLPADAYAQVVAARIYSVFDRREEALAAYSRALAISPDAYIYLNRFRTWSEEEGVAREADLDEALKRDPDLAEAIVEKAKLLTKRGEIAAALQLYDGALVRMPDNDFLRFGRGLAYAKMGDVRRSDEDFARVRGKTVGAEELHRLCWRKATNGVALESALDDCRDALRLAPDNVDFLDSVGFVLLRLDRVDEAISAYGDALAKRPASAASLFGRSLAWGRKGDRVKAQADREAALRLSPKVQEQFKAYGLTT
jgi:tetratricopeptide (TPR) repeat protein